MEIWMKAVGQFLGDSGGFLQWDWDGPITGGWSLELYSAYDQSIASRLQRRTGDMACD